MAVMKLGRGKPRAQTKNDRSEKPGPNVKMGLPDLRGRGGHPTILTEALIEEFARLIPTVAYIETAGDLLGISGFCWKNWVVDGRGEQKNIDTVPGYTPDPRRALTLRFYQMYRAALAQYSVNNLTKIHVAGDRDWRAAAWLMERRFYAQWGDKARDIAELRKQLDEMEKSLLKSGAKPTPVSELTKEDRDGGREGSERDTHATPGSPPGGEAQGDPVRGEHGGDPLQATATPQAQG